ncbi:hypothetical protein NQX30_02130 [Candidatus Persebacteraceae bacterium Df01]|uniref:Uncharacterized protein n=1 Tax=Candidatus Doriopsillibacter californiensis TaxID=2970740 RepID=A0ABT7QKD9_9GAMM|nr:hypothetical protein [Candidatus Persebacteraceae bacterium Df01]
MREIIALMLLYVAAQFVDVGSEEGSFGTALGLIISIGLILFLALALAERFYTNMGKWFRVTPGTPQFYDDDDENSSS